MLDVSIEATVSVSAVFLRCLLVGESYCCRVDLSSALLAYAIPAALITMLPGPDTAMMLATALKGGRAAAVRASWGVGTGLLLWGAAAAAGLAAALRSSAVLYDVFRLACVMYLLVLAGQSLLASRRQTPDTPPPTDPRAGRRHRLPSLGWGYRRALLTCVLNPKLGVALVDGVPWWFGPLTTPWTPPRPGVHVVGVRLSLAAGRRAAGGSLRQWRNTRARLGTVWAPAAAMRLAAQAARLGSDVERADLLVEAVLAHVDAVEPADGVAAALAELVCTDIPVAEIARRVGLSSRQVHRRCLDEFGLAPSLLRRIARVYRAARHTAGAGRPPLARLAADAGFADQAHFCREIRALSGETPRAAFG